LENWRIRGLGDWGRRDGVTERKNSQPPASLKAPSKILFEVLTHLTGQAKGAKEEKRKRISHARPKQALRHRARQEKEIAGGRGLIFISTESVYMNNMLPAGGEKLYDFSGSEKTQNSLLCALCASSGVFEAGERQRERISHARPKKA